MEPLNRISNAHSDGDGNRDGDDDRDIEIGIETYTKVFKTSFFLT